MKEEKERKEKKKRRRESGKHAARVPKNGDRKCTKAKTQKKRRQCRMIE
jgi:hypothetical protein